MQEIWKTIKYDNKYQVSNLGRFRKILKNGYRYLKPFRKKNLILVKIKYQDFNCARLVADAFIQSLSNKDRVFHKNGIQFDNNYRNLKVITLKDLGKKTGHISKSKAVVQIECGEIIKWWRSARSCAKELYISYQTVNDYCNKKVEKPMFNLMWEDDFKY